MKALAEVKSIAGLECYSRKKAASYLGISVVTLDRMMRLSRAGRMKTPLKFIQSGPCAPVWFPKVDLDRFVTGIIDHGRALK